MSESAQAKFSCPSCGRHFTWKPELAGRSAKCKCGGTIKVPAHPEAAAAAPAIAAAATAAEVLTGCPSCGSAIQAGAVLCVQCGFNLKTGKRMSTVMGGIEPEAPGPTIAPPGLAAAGVPGIAGYAGPPGLRPPTRAEETTSPAAVVKMIAIPVVLIAVVGGAVFGFKKLSGEKDTGPRLGQDPQVRAMIREDGATELKQWLKDSPHRMVLGMTREQADGLADRLYTMGAVKVMAFGGATTASLALELPDAKVEANKEKRKAIFDWYKRRYEENTSRARRTRDEGQQYLLIPLSL